MTASYRTIVFSDADAPVARITLNQPDKRNPLSPEVAGELVHALGVVGERADLVAVVLTGAGSVFSAGGDLGRMQAGQSPSPGQIPPVSLLELLVTMHRLGKPIVAMVNGHALAGGLGLMVACDLVVASDQATFGTTEIRLGLWPMMITAELTRNIGRKKALELMLTGKRIDAEEAERLGLVNRVAPAAELEARTMELARALASMSPATMRLGLRSFYDTQDMELEPALRYLEAELTRVLALEDAHEGIAAFFEKREPVWKGR